MLPLAASLALEDNSARGVVRRALVLSNGALGAEGQCVGLVRALGLHGADGWTSPPGGEVFDVRLVGDAALKMSRRLGAAWSERLSHSMGARQLVKRGGPRQAPLPSYLECIARLVARLPVAWRVSLHAMWDRIFSQSGVGDRVWLGADLAPMTRGAMEAYRRDRTRTLVVSSGRSTVPASAALRRRCGHAVFTVHVRDPKCDVRVFDMVIAPEYESPGLLARGMGGDGVGWGEVKEDKEEKVCVTRAVLHRLDSEALATAREKWRKHFSTRPGPRLVVCVGGSTRDVNLGGWSRREESSPGTRFGDAGADFWGSVRFFLATAERRARRAIETARDWRGVRRNAAAEEEFAAEVADFVTRACADPVAARRAMGAGADQPKPFRFGSAFVTFSRRTPRSLRAALHRHLARRAVELAHVDSPAHAPAASMSTIDERDDENDDERDEKNDQKNGRLVLGPKIDRPRDAPRGERCASPIHLPVSDGLWVWDETGPNPYDGAMAWADAVLVTADSASALAEASSLGVPVAVAGWRFATGEAAMALSSLATCGTVRAMEDVEPDAPWLGAAARVGAFAKRRSDEVASAGSDEVASDSDEFGFASDEFGFASARRSRCRRGDDVAKAAASVAKAVRVEAPPPRLASNENDGDYGKRGDENQNQNQNQNDGDDESPRPTSPLFRSASAPPVGTVDPRRKLW